jgi:protein disulfide-isomerase
MRHNGIKAGILAFMLLMANMAFAVEGSVWLDDFEKAKKLAAEKKLPILAYFSGSDWCGWCKRLDSEVLSQEVFKKFAGENFVLFIADFPSRKKQGPEVVKQNKELQKRYGVEGFPTLLVLKTDGAVTARTGYRRGGAAKYVDHLREIRP